jgi:hypothetical protein
VAVIFVTATNTADLVLANTYSINAYNFNEVYGSEIWLIVTEVGFPFTCINIRVP